MTKPRVYRSCPMECCPFNLDGFCILSENERGEIVALKRSRKGFNPSKKSTKLGEVK